MRFHLCAVGRKMPAWVDAGFQDYARRMPGGSRLDLHAVAGARNAGSVADEGRRLLGSTPKGARRIALDGAGKALATADWAERATEWSRTGAVVAFLVGGADGLSTEVIEAADERWSLSPLTLPHGLVRVVVAEQLYRTLSILHNHPYHR